MPSPAEAATAGLEESVGSLGSARPGWKTGAKLAMWPWSVKKIERAEVLETR